MTYNRTRHPVSLYIAGKSKPEQPNDRLVVLTWKGNKETGREAHSARCFSVPQWFPELTGKDEQFVEMLVDAVEQGQKKLAHKYVTECLVNNGGVCNDIPNEIVAPQTVLADFLEEQEKDDGRGKLSSVQIVAWFVEQLKDVVIMTLMEKKGWLEEGVEVTKEQEKLLNQTANGFRATMEKLASPRPALSRDNALALQRAMELLPVEKRKVDGMARKIEKKIDGILNPKMDDVVDLSSLL